MSLDSADQAATTVDRTPGYGTTRRRVAALAVFLAITAPLGILALLLWPQNSGPEGTFLVSDFDSGRGTWWWLLTVGAITTVLTVGAQSLATLVVVRERGARWAEWGAGLMLIGAATQAVGLSTVQAAYFSASGPALGEAVRTAVFHSINTDQAHLFGALLTGELTTVVGTILQAVALFRSHAVPKWVPLASLTTVLSIVEPVETASSLIFSVPMAAAAVGIGYYAYKQVSGPATP